MKISEYHFPSATGECEIHGCAYLPNDSTCAKAVMVVHHGMAEHRGRYKEFFEYLTSLGFVVYMHDMANHGKSNQDYDLTGYFGKSNGYNAIIKDFKTTFDRAKTENPDKKIIVMGHSMGSFVVRCFTAIYSDAGFDGAIYMGTGGPNPIFAAGDKVTALVAKLCGYSKKVKLLDSMIFGAYNKKFDNRTGYEWLTRDSSIVDEYVADKYCGFTFSAQGMNDLVKLTMNANSDEFFKKIPHELPILLISGAMDPVGDYSNGINLIADKLNQTNHTNVTVKLFENCRHEVLNELNKDEVYDYLSQWIEGIL